MRGRTCQRLRLGRVRCAFACDRQDASNTYLGLRVLKKSRGPQNAGWVAAQRILELLEKHETYPSLARRIGVDSKTLRAYLRGESGASVDVVAKAVRVGGVNAHWLLTGEGPRYMDTSPSMETAESEPLLVSALEKARGVVEDLSRAAAGRRPESAHEVKDRKDDNVILLCAACAATHRRKE